MSSGSEVIRTSGMIAKGDAQAQDHLAEHERQRRVDAESEHDQRRDERDDPACDHRNPNGQKTMHDLGAGRASHGGRRESGGEEADREHHGYARAERILDRGMRAVDGVGAGYSAQRRSGQKQHADVHATGDDQRDDDIPTGDFE